MKAVESATMTRGVTGRSLQCGDREVSFPEEGIPGRRERSAGGLKRATSVLGTEQRPVWLGVWSLKEERAFQA